MSARSGLLASGARDTFPNFRAMSVSVCIALLPHPRCLVIAPTLYPLEIHSALSN